MYDVVVEQEISAAHQLGGYQGQCERFHGHNWRVQLEVGVKDLDPLGLAVDFTDLKALLEEILSEYDHTLLNEHPDFRQQNPTSENLARMVYERCREKVKHLHSNAAVNSVTVWESPRTFVRYHA